MKHIKSNSKFRIPRYAFRNQKGIALVMVLVLSAIGLALMSTLIYMITLGTQASGLQKQYKTALEAGRGGVDITLQVVAMKDKDFSEIEALKSTLTGKGIPTEFKTPNSCTETVSGRNYTGLQTKLRMSSTDWVNCSDTIADIDTTYDMSFKIGAGLRYNVYAKVVDTQAGSIVGATGDSSLHDIAVVDTKDIIIAPGIPNLYTIEVLAENSANPREKARYQVLYQY